MQVFHAVPHDHLQHVLHGGLQYGQAGAYSQDQLTQQTNSYLDDRRPPYLTQLHVSRHDCLYAYLAWENKLWDIADGSLCEPRHWQPGQDMAGLALTVNPATAYVSDLDCYDELTTALIDDGSPPRWEALAKRYWERLVPLYELTQYYIREADDLVRRSGAPSHLPQQLHRMEVMLTESVPANHIMPL